MQWEFDESYVYCLHNMLAKVSLCICHAVYYRWVWDGQINTSGPIVYRDHSVFSNKLDPFFETDWSRGGVAIWVTRIVPLFGESKMIPIFPILCWLKNNWPKIEPVNDVLTNGSFWGPFGRMMLPQKLIKSRPKMCSKLGRNQTLCPKGVIWHSVTSVLIQLESTTFPSIPSTTYAQ